MSGSTMSQTVFCFHLYIFGKSIRILWDVNTEWESSVAELHLSPPPHLFTVCLLMTGSEGMEHSGARRCFCSALFALRHLAQGQHGIVCLCAYIYCTYTYKLDIEQGKKFG